MPKFCKLINQPVKQHDPKRGLENREGETAQRKLVVFGGDLENLPRPFGHAEEQKPDAYERPAG